VRDGVEKIIKDLDDMKENFEDSFKAMGV